MLRVPAFDSRGAGSDAAEAAEIGGAQKSFLKGDDWAYIAGIVAVVIGGVLVFFMFPKNDEEDALLCQYHAEDMPAPAPGPATT